MCQGGIGDAGHTHARTHTRVRANNNNRNNRNRNSNSKTWLARGDRCAGWMGWDGMALTWYCITTAEEAVASRASERASRRRQTSSQVLSAAVISVRLPTDAGTASMSAMSGLAASARAPR